MPVWSVSEPYISLWLHDEPLGYQPALGPRVSFQLAFKQREFLAGWNPAIFSVGRNWNCSWLSYVARDANSNTVVNFPGGGQRTFFSTDDYLTNTRLIGDTTNGFTLSRPDGSKDVYGFIVTNSSGGFQEAYLTERWNTKAQKTRLTYFSYNPADRIVRLQHVIGGDGLTNTIFYVTDNPYSTNLIAQVVDPFGRTTSLLYNTNGFLTNITDVVGIASSFAYNTNNWITNLTTPYGATTFAFTDTRSTNIAPNGRSVLVTEPDGSKQLFLYTNGASGVASSYSGGEIPVTSPFSETFETNNLHLRNSFHWNRQQYADLSTTTISAFTSSDFSKAQMKHWLRNGPNSVGETLALERAASPDGTIEGQKTWHDHAGKTNNAYEGTQFAPLISAQVMPDGTTRFIRTQRNSLGMTTNEVSTWSTDGSVLLRTNKFTYAANEIDLLAVTNALGVGVSRNAYNAYHQILTNWNALNEMTVFTYDTSNRLSSVTRPGGLVTTNIYGSDKYVSQMIDVGIATNSFTWENGLVATHTDTRGLTVNNSWDALQRLRRVNFSDGAFITNTYDKLDLVKTVDRMGFATSFGYDPLRRMVAATNANNVITRYGYCGCGSVTSITNAWGTSLEQVTQNIFDLQGNLFQSQGPDGYTVTHTHNALGQLIVSSDGATSITNFYNNQGLLIAVSNAFGRVVAVKHDILDRATNTVDANNVSLTMAYDSLHRLRARSYANGAVEGFDYALNISGPIRYTNQLQQVTRWGYDIAGRRTAETNANQEVTRFNYNGASDLLTLTDGKNQITTWKYDSFGRTTNKVDATSTQIFRFAYDANDRLTNRWSAAKGNTAYTFDAVGNLLSVNYPTSPDITLQYDALNRLTNMADAVGTTRYSYNAASQLLSEDGPWADDTVGYGYQYRLRTSLNLLQPGVSAWTQSYGYDAATRLTNVISSAGAFGYTYATGQSLRLSQISLPNGSYITNNYDAMTRLLGTTLKNSGGTVLNSHAYGYNIGNQRTALTNTAGDYRNFGYDSIGQLKTTVGFEANATARLNEQMGYAYDAAGNLNHHTNNAFVQTFNVDSLNQLSTINRSGTLTVAGTTTSSATNVTVNAQAASLYADYTFAKAGFGLVDGTTNFTAVARDNYGRVDTNTVTVNLSATASFIYDLNGNLRTNGTRIFDYDDENQLTRITESNLWKSEFTYDGANRRRTETNYVWQGGVWVATNVVRFVYDGGVIVQHRGANNLPTLTLTRGLDLSLSLQGVGGLLAMTENSGTHSYYHADGGGNVTALMNANQLLVGKYLYDPFGNTLSLNGPKTFTNPYRFSSKPIHELSGDYDFLRRWYDPSLQRWLNRDPIGEEGGINLYGYVFNDPVNLIDDWGMQARPSVRGAITTEILEALHRPGNYSRSAGSRIPTAQERIAAVISREAARRQMANEGLDPNLSYIGPPRTPVRPPTAAELAEHLRQHPFDPSVSYCVIRPGRRGSEATQNQLDRLRDNFLGKYPEYQHTHGGRNAQTGIQRPEEYIAGPGGNRKGSSYPDLTFQGPNLTVRVNTVDTVSSGAMTPRELNNFGRIMLQTGEPVILVPKIK